MTHSLGFDAISRSDADVLISGALVGKVSPETGEYYALSMDHFWRVGQERFRGSERLPGAAPAHRTPASRARILNASFERPMTLRFLNLLCTATLLALLASCGGDSKSQAPPITVAFDPNFPPPAQLNTGAYAPIAAVVTNDNQNAGVNFTCTPAGACGTFTPATTGSGTPVCYLAPAEVPTGGTATVTATSVTDATKFKSATINIISGLPNPCP
jgi:hypothetical protein